MYDISAKNFVWSPFLNMGFVKSVPRIFRGIPPVPVTVDAQGTPDCQEARMWKMMLTFRHRAFSI